MTTTGPRGQRPVDAARPASSRNRSSVAASLDPDAPAPGTRSATQTGGAISEIGPPPVAFRPDWALPPGTILRKELAARGMSQADLSQRTGLSPKHINQVVMGSASLSPDVALRLERAMGTSSAVWLSLEAHWQNHVAREEAGAALLEHVEWAKRFPVKELIGHGVLSGSEQGSTLVEVILRLFQVATPNAFEQVWLAPVAGFRRSQKHDVDPLATITWLRLGEMAAEDLPLARWNPARLRGVLPKLRGFTRLADADGFRQAQTLLAACGVATVYVPEIVGSRACGATRWRTGGTPLIVLSGRYRHADSFWFTLFHEIAHILLHPRRATYVDLDGEYGDDQDGQESEANDYAAELLIPASFGPRLVGARRFSQLAVLADEAGVDQGIVAGRYGHLTNNWQLGARLRHRLDLAGL